MKNPFHFQKFDLEQIYVYRSGIPVTDSPISTTDNKRLYFNTISDLAYIDNGHGISLSDYPNHFIMVFDLTSTHQASHDFIHLSSNKLFHIYRVEVFSGLTDQD